MNHAPGNFVRRLAGVFKPVVDLIRYSFHLKFKNLARLAHFAQNPDEPRMGKMTLIGDFPRGRQPLRAQGHHDQVPQELVFRRHPQVNSRRQHPLAQVEHLFEPLPFLHQQLAAPEQLLQRALGRLPLEPAAAAVTRRRLEIPGPERPLDADTVQHVAPYLIVTPEPVPLTLRESFHPA